MSGLDGLLHGLSVALRPEILLLGLLGIVIGMVIGALPGIGPAAAIAVLLPVTYTMDPAGAIIMLAGIYYGSEYGGRISSILLGLPGDAGAVVTVFDGHPMAKQGRGGPALAISGIGSFLGGIFAVVCMIFAGPFVANLALEFGPPEFALVAAIGLGTICLLGSAPFLTNLMSASVGLLLATVGTDAITGTQRLTFGSAELYSGLSFVAIVIGLYGAGEILATLRNRSETTKNAGVSVRGAIYPNRTDLRKSGGAIGRGSLIGFLIGNLPGGGGMVGSMAAYAYEKKRSKNPERFGRGAIEGVAAPESANNASATSSFIPMLTLGIPSNAIMAMIFGALVVHGITPGPSLIDERPDMFWGLIASMVVGNLVLLVLNLPMIGLFVRVLDIPFRHLAAFVAVSSLIGAYSVHLNFHDIIVLCCFGLLGWLLRLMAVDPAPMVLGLVLGPILESSVRRSLLISNGSPTVFVNSGLARGLVAIVVVLITVSLVRAWRRRRTQDTSRTQDINQTQDISR